MKRFFLSVVGALAAVVVLSACVGNMRDDGPTGAPPLFAEPGDGASTALGLVNLWRVSGAAGETEQTWLRLDAGEFQLWRDCGMVMGSWRATDAVFLADVGGASGDCATDEMPSVPWLAFATAFVETADGFDLLAPTGEVLASLSIDGAPEPIDTAAEFFAQPPELTEQVYALFRAPAQLPTGLVAANADALPGRWVPAGATFSTEPHVSFAADGTWAGSDGCNGGSGRWAVSESGQMLATSGPSTLMFCDGAPVPSWVALVAVAGLDAANTLHLFDAAGAELGALTRS